MKTKKVTRNLANMLYTFLVCVFCVGCVKKSTGFDQFRISKCPYCDGEAYVHEAINGDGGWYTVDCLNEYNEQTDCERLLNRWYNSFEEAVSAWENAH